MRVSLANAAAEQGIMFVNALPLGQLSDPILHRIGDLTIALSPDGLMRPKWGDL